MMQPESADKRMLSLSRGHAPIEVLLHMFPIKLTLPYPPSVNHYWVWTGRTWIIGKRGAAFIRDVHFICVGKRYHLKEKLKATAYVYPPDKRDRDLDNLGKALWDSLEKAGVYENDKQIKELHMKFCEPCKPGRVEVTLDLLD